jgi:hypothetical protein
MVVAEAIGSATTMRCLRSRCGAVRTASRRGPPRRPTIGTTVRAFRGCCRRCGGRCPAATLRSPAGAGWWCGCGGACRGRARTLVRPQRVDRAPAHSRADPRRRRRRPARRGAREPAPGPCPGRGGACQDPHAGGRVPAAPRGHAGGGARRGGARLVPAVAGSLDPARGRPAGRGRPGGGPAPRAVRVPRSGTDPHPLVRRRRGRRSAGAPGRDRSRGVRLPAKPGPDQPVRAGQADRRCPHRAPTHSDTLAGRCPRAGSTGHRDGEDAGQRLREPPSRPGHLADLGGAATPPPRSRPGRYRRRPTGLAGVRLPRPSAVGPWAFQRCRSSGT